MRIDLLTSCVVAVCVICGAAACEPPGGDGGDEGSETSGAGDGDGDTDPGDGDADAGDGDGDPGDGDGDPGDGDGDGDPGACAPRDPNVSFSYQLPEINMFDPFSTDLDWTCTVSEVDVSEGLHLVLDCPNAVGPVVLDVQATPGFSSPVFGGETIHMRYVSEGPWWFNVYLRLDMDGYGHLLTLLDGDSLLPPPDYAFELPFDLQPQYEVCAPVPDACGDLERLVLGFDANGEPVELIDGSYASVGGIPGTEVWVIAAGRLHDIECTDTPDEWYRVLIADTGWE